MSSTATASPIPAAIADRTAASATSTSPLPRTKHKIRRPLLRLEVRDLSEDSAAAFLALPDVATILGSAVDTVLALLYETTTYQPTGDEDDEDDPTTSTTPAPPAIPPVRSVTLILRPMSGVAYTTGIDLDTAHKEIHVSTTYLAGLGSTRFAAEARGVLVHEMVHCWQHDARGSAPGGLIEGVADWVRLRAGLAPPHWGQAGRTSGTWDAGYEHTGFFLDWLERRTGGEGSVRRLNSRLGKSRYEEAKVWRDVFGAEVDDLWDEYRQAMDQS